MIEMLILWIVGCIVFTCLEAMTQQFVSLWFIIGSLVALVLAIFQVDSQLQWIAFALVSCVSLIAFRPMLKRFMASDIQPTNTDSNIGQLALVTTSFDELTKEGRVLVNDMDWAAKSLDGVAYQRGEKVVVDHIEGVKCLVKKL